MPKLRNSAMLREMYCVIYNDVVVKYLFIYLFIEFAGTARHIKTLKLHSHRVKTAA